MGLLGSSSSKSSSTTNQSDNRVVSDAQAQAVSSGGVNAKDYASPVNVTLASAGYKRADVTVNQSDYGAINAALKFAGEANTASTKTVQDVLGVSSETFDKTSTALQDAYKDAKGGALVLQNVTIAMMMTIAAVAYFWLGKKKQ